MSRITGEILIERPVDEVFDYVVDERNEPNFNPRMKHSEKLTDGPIGSGTRFAATMGSVRRQSDMVVEYGEVDRPHVLPSVSTLGWMTVRGSLHFEPVDGNTLLSWDFDVKLNGALHLLQPVVALIGRRQEQATWSSLKRLLEAAG